MPFPTGWPKQPLDRLGILTDTAVVPVVGEVVELLAALRATSQWLSLCKEPALQNPLVLLQSFVCPHGSAAITELKAVLRCPELAGGKEEKAPLHGSSGFWGTNLPCKDILVRLVVVATMYLKLSCTSEWPVRLPGHRDAAEAHDVLGGHPEVVRQFGAVPRTAVWDQEGCVGHGYSAWPTESSPKYSFVLLTREDEPEGTRRGRSAGTFESGRQV